MRDIFDDVSEEMVATVPATRDLFDEVYDEVSPEPEPVYRSKMFETPEGEPTLDTETVRAWETPNSITAIGKTPANIVSQFQPTVNPAEPEIMSQSEPDLFDEVYDTFLGVQNAPQNEPTPPEATTTPSMIFSPFYAQPQGQTAIPGDTALQAWAKEAVAGAGRAVLTTGGVLGSALRGGAQLATMPFAAAEQLPLTPIERAYGGLGVKTEREPGPGVASEFFKELGKPSAPEEFIAGVNQKSFENTLKEGGVGAAIAQGVSQDIFKSFYDTALTLGIAGGGGKKAKDVISKVPGAIKATVESIKKVAPEAVKFASFTFATTPGDIAERAKAAGHSAALIMAPASTAGFPTPWLAKAASFLALTGAGTIPGLKETYQAAEDLSEQTGISFEEALAAKLTPQLLMNALFGAQARSATADANKYVASRRNALINEMRQQNPELTGMLEKFAEQKKVEPIATEPKVEPSTPVPASGKTTVVADIATAEKKFNDLESRVMAEQETGRGVDVDLYNEYKAAEKSLAELKKASPPPPTVPPDQTAPAKATLAETPKAAGVEPIVKPEPISKPLPETPSQVEQTAGKTPEGVKPEPVKQAEQPKAEVPVRDTGVFSEEQAKETEVTDAPRVREDTGQPVESRIQPGEGEGKRGENIQQPPQSKEPLAQRKQAEPFSPGQIEKETTTPEDRQNGERYFDIKNDKTGEVTKNATIEDLSPFKAAEKPTQQKAGRVSLKTEGLNKRLEKLGLNPDEYKSDEEKQRAIIKKIGQPPASASDFARESAERQKAGAVSVGSIDQTLRKVKDWFSRNFGPTHGVGKELDTIVQEWRRKLSAGGMQARITAKELANVRDDLSKSKPKQDVMNALNEVLTGAKTLDEFANEMNINRNDSRVKTLEKHLNEKKALQQNLADLLEKSGNDPVLVKQIKEADYYLHRFYEAHVKGSEYYPGRRAIEKASIEVSDGFTKTVAKIEKWASKVQKKLPNVDLPSYLETGDTTLLAGLSPDVVRRVNSLRKAYQKYKELIDATARQGDDVVMTLNAEAIADAANSTVNYYLAKQQGKTPSKSSPIDVGALHKRYLEGVFRELYGEITDPVLRAGRTAEIQEKLVATQVLMNRIFTEGRDQWWSSFAREGKGLTEKLPDDPMRYGNLAGKFVSKATMDLIGASEKPNPILQGYYNLKGTMRLLKLYGPRTIVRNAYQSVLGFAMQNGDALRPEYGRNLIRANILLAKSMRGNVDAMKQMKDFAEMDVFRTQTQSFLDDINNLSSTAPSTKVEKAKAKLGEWYAYIDMPAKVASYWTELNRLKSQGVTGDQAKKQAAEHVRKFYQHAESLPKFVRTLSKLPLSDYPGYFMDSMRITANGLAHAVKSAAKGDLAPALGFALSHALGASITGAQVQMLNDAWKKVHAKMRDDDKDIAKTQDLTPKEMTQFRQLLPRYYQETPLYVWKEKYKNGKTKIFYTVTGNQSAWPMEDIIVAALQSSDGKVSEFVKQLGQGVVQNRLGVGMLEKTIWKMVTGDELGGTFKSEGIDENLPFGNENPNKAKIWAEALGWGTAEIFGGQLTSAARELWAVESREQRGEKWKAGTYTPKKTKEDVLMSKVAMVRSYAVDDEEMSRTLRRQVLNLRDGIEKAQTNIRKKSGNPIADQEFINDKMSEIRNLVQVVKTTDVLSDSAIRAILKDAGFSQDDAWRIFRGRELKPYKPEAKKRYLQTFLKNTPQESEDNTEGAEQ